MKNEIKVLVVCSNNDVTKITDEIGKISKEINVKYTADTYKKALSLINNKDNAIDAILVDSANSKEDIFSFLKSFNDEADLSKTILIDNLKLDCYNRVSTKYQIFNVLPTSYRPEELIVSLREIKEKGEIYNLKKISLYDEIAEVLKKLGIAPDKNGFHYLRKAIYECYSNPKLLTSITKEIYPMLSDTFQKKESCIERSIRSAIETGWDRGDYEYSNKLFSSCVDYYKTKPTNGEFIAIVVDKLMLEKGCLSY